MSGDDAEVDLLIETDSSILDQIRKDLNQEYLRLMSRALQMSRGAQSGALVAQEAQNLKEKSNYAARRVIDPEECTNGQPRQGDGSSRRGYRF